MEQSDEVSIIDLILIFIKRRYLFLTAFMVSIVISSGFIYKINKTETYLTVLELASLDNELVSRPESLLADLDTTFYYRIVSSPDLKSLINSTKYFYPRNSKVIKIETEGSDKETIRAFHQKILDHLTSLDNANYQKNYKQLEKRITDLQALISITNEVNSFNPVDKAKYESEIKDLSLKLKSAKSNSVLLDAESKKMIEGSKTKKMVLVGVGLSLMAGVLFVFLVEGIHAVRIQLKKQ